VSVKVEVKGDVGKQTIPLTLSHGWNYTKASINWNLVGDLKEAVFVVSPLSGGQAAAPMGASVTEEISTLEVAPLTGIIRFDIDFYKLSFFEKYSTYVKLFSLFFISLFLAFLTTVFSVLYAQKHSEEEEMGGGKMPLAFNETSFVSCLRKDVLYGMVAVLIAGVALWIYSLGTKGLLDAGFSFNFLAVGLIGAAIVEVLKSSFTGKHVTPREVFMNVLLAGFLAASSSNQALWQAPATWMQLLMVSNLTASLTFLIYHIANACSLASSQKTIKPFTGLLIVATPYLFGWLLLLQNVSLLQSLVNALTIGLLSAWPLLLAVLGRIIIVFGFNEAITNGLSMLTKGQTLKGRNAHLFILFVSAGVIIAPRIADLV